MHTLTKQANFSLPKDILDDLKKNVPRKEQNKVVADAIKKELKSIKLERTLDESFGIWNYNNHPELGDKYIKKLRKSTRIKRNSGWEKSL